MVKLVMTVNATDRDGKPLAAGQEVDVDEETANQLRADGKAGLPYVPSDEEGIYTARTARPDEPAPPPAKAPRPVNAPAADKEK